MLRVGTQTLKIILIGSMALSVALGGQRFFNYYLDREAAADIGQPVSFTVKKDDDSDSVAARLHDAGLVRSELYFKTRMRISSAELKPATYTLHKGMSVPRILQTITSDGQKTGSKDQDSATAVDVKLTTIEGWRTEQIADEIAKTPIKGGAEAFIAATKQIDTTKYEFLADRPAGASLEGFLFPDTYTLKSTIAPDDVIYQMLDDFDKRLTPEMRRQAEDRGLTMYQVVTMASIIEREAAAPKERPIIASVYYNRLNQGMPLQADPTVQYPLGKPGNWWPDLQPGQPQQVKSNYNSYLHDGWPPGPICNPSLASIQAALDPAQTDYLYFVAKGDGTHAFTADYEEQQQNIATYQSGGDGGDGGDSGTDSNSAAVYATETP